MKSNCLQIVIKYFYYPSRNKENLPQKGHNIFLLHSNIQRKRERDFKQREAVKSLDNL